MALFSLFQGGGGNRKKAENSTLSLYLLYLYHVWKSRWATAPCPPLPTPIPL